MTTTTAPSTLTGTYAIDPTHSRIGFVARHAMVTKVRGSFNEFAGSGYVDAENPAASSLRLTIQAASIDTRNADRDGHLKSNDFFDMETYPTITFTSTAVEQTDDDEYRVTGDLTIKGVTKPVAVEFEYTGAATDPFGNHRIGLEGKTTVNRKEWGVNWNAALEAGGVLVSEKVTRRPPGDAFKAESSQRRSSSSAISVFDATRRYASPAIASISSQSTASSPEVSRKTPSHPENVPRADIGGVKKRPGSALTSSS